MQKVTKELINSKDGTSIAYYKIGKGPGLLLIYGTMGTAYNFKELAEHLSDSFTVYTYDRRDKGASSKGKSEYGIQREIEDVSAILEATNTSYVFGLSSGAIVALNSSLALPTIKKMAIYEPPLFPTTESLPTKFINQYEDEIGRGNIAKALIAGMKAGQFAPPVMNIMPNSLLAKLTQMMLNQEAKKGSGGYVPMSELAYGLHNDFYLVETMAGTFDSYKNVTIRTLILGGSKSQAYLKNALDVLENTLPNANRIELEGLDHGAAGNTDRRGKPKQIADQLRAFFIKD